MLDIDTVLFLSLINVIFVKSYI